MAHKVGESYQAARAIEKQYQARLAKVEYERRIGELLPKSDVEYAISNAVTIFRSAMESLEVRLAPQVAIENDPSKCRAIIHDAIYEHLENLSSMFKKAIKTK